MIYGRGCSDSCNNDQNVNNLKITYLYESVKNAIKEKMQKGEKLYGR